MNNVENKIQIGLCIGTGFVSEGIELAEQIGDPGRDHYFSHAFIKTPNPSDSPIEYLVIEALASGVAKEKWIETDYFRAYTGEKDANVKFCLLEYPVTLTDAQVKAIADKAYSLIDSGYDFWSYPSLVTKILFKRLFGKKLWWWKKGKSAEHENFCSEVCADSINAGMPGFFPEPYATSPQDIYDYVLQAKLKIVWKNF